MEPAEDRPDDVTRQPGTQVIIRGAMEPAEDRPDDVRAVRERRALVGGAMEPAEDRPDDVRVGVRRVGGAAGAMEPAEDRPDDPPGRPRPRNTTGRVQWSRPRIGRMTRRGPAPCPRW